MAGFTQQAFEKKLSELNTSQQSIQTLSLWLIHHRKHYKTIVQTWFKELKKGWLIKVIFCHQLSFLLFFPEVKPSRRLIFMYLANDVIQNSRKKGRSSVYLSDKGSATRFLSQSFSLIGPLPQTTQAVHFRPCGAGPTAIGLSSATR